MPARSPLPPGDHARELFFGPNRRSYWVHVPEGYDGSTWPLVMVLHAGRINGRQMMDFCGLNAAADRHRFLLVYPEGTGRDPLSLTWNAGRCCGEAQAADTDDVGFLERLLAKLPRWLPYDPSRVYAIGASNGGMMAQRLATEQPELLRAVASISGPLELTTPNDTSIGEEFLSAKPVPFLYCHGTKDEFIPFEGGTGPKSMAALNFRSVEQTIAAWVKRNRCQPEPEQTLLTAQVEDGTQVTCSIYRPQAHQPKLPQVEAGQTGDEQTGAEVFFFTIVGGGHTWPGQQPRPGSPMGVSTQNLDGNAAIWEFFCRASEPRSLPSS